MTGATEEGATAEGATAEAGPRIVLLLGAPRSGTTWLGKIFDSHPDVLYRHEPDAVDRGGGLPKVVAAGDVAAWSAQARAYLLRLAALGRLRTAGQLPLFRKHYRGGAAQRLQAAEIYLLRMLALVPGLARPAERVPVPDLARRKPHTIAIKSVISCGCTGLYADALPEARIVFLVRPPFGQIASMLQGTQLGKLDGAQATQGLGGWPVAARHGLSEAALARLPLVERLAWLWVLQNEMALDGLAGRPGVHVAAYRALRADPLGEARALFAFAGLDWAAQTEAFLAASTHAAGREGYYTVHRDTAAPEKKWRALLSATDRAGIAAIVRQSALAQFLDPEADTVAG